MVKPNQQYDSFSQDIGRARGVGLIIALPLSKKGAVGYTPYLTLRGKKVRAKAPSHQDKRGLKKNSHQDPRAQTRGGNVYERNIPRTYRLPHSDWTARDTVSG